MIPDDEWRDLCQEIWFDNMELLIQFMYRANVLQKTLLGKFIEGLMIDSNKNKNGG